MVAHATSGHIQKIYGSGGFDVVSEVIYWKTDFVNNIVKKYTLIVYLPVLKLFNERGNGIRLQLCFGQSFGTFRVGGPSCFTTFMHPKCILGARFFIGFISG